MPSALELVREVRRSIDGSHHGNPIRFEKWCDKLDAALAEMERDREFIEAAERLLANMDACRHWEHDGSWHWDAELAMDAYRKRREGMKRVE